MRNTAPQLRTQASLLVAWARALHEAGAPAHRVEEGADALLEAWGLRGAVAATPTVLWVEVEGEARVIRMAPGGMNLWRLREVGAWGRALAGGELRARPSGCHWRPGWRRASEVFGAAGAAVLFGGGLPEAVVAGGVGWMVMEGARVFSAGGDRGRAALGGPVQAALAAGLAQVGAWLGADPAPVAMAAVVGLLPGLSMVGGLSEIAQGHWSAGSVRLVGVVASLVGLAGGLALGLGLGTPAPVVVWPEGPGWLCRPLAALAPLWFSVQLSVHPRDLPAVGLLAAVAWSLAWSGLPGALLWASLAVALGGRWLARAEVSPEVPDALTTPPQVWIVPGILLLVPGAMGLEGATMLLDGALIDGLLAALGAGRSALLLVTGLLLAWSLPRGLFLSRSQASM